MLRVLGWCGVTGAAVVALGLIPAGLATTGSWLALVHGVAVHWQLPAIMFTAVTALMSCASLHELYHWNNGMCRAYNEPWEYFDTDSQGGRGYKCRDKTIWVSYPGVDRVQA